MLLAPEAMVSQAVREWRFVRSNVVKYKFRLSPSQAFLFVMGGFEIAGKRIMHSQHLKDEEALQAIQAVSDKEILSKGKSDVYAKAAAVTTTLWFFPDFVSRLVQQLPVSELEVATAASCTVSLVLWFLWWSKPHKVETPTKLNPRGLVLGGEPMDDGWLNQALYGQNYMAAAYDPYLPTSSSQWSRRKFPRTKFVHRGPIVFGLIHCVAWNAKFPSQQELAVWRTASLLAVILPIGIVVSTHRLHRYARDNARAQSRPGTRQIGSSEQQLDAQEGVSRATQAGLVCIYIVARLCHIGLIIAALRAQPDMTFVAAKGWF
ncbi:hypothetical protein C8F04DRAFT_1351094 [Mycena alexandri]|uniref:Uncharacterized protein n=1 Tax=Mycena alexandri TaxID=1745969 RepID=A0AAD6XCD2_9AGAR|nr:hypothetical protein C8F04DRAFT_1351094 [Mycena alexandri]